MVRLWWQGVVLSSSLISYMYAAISAFEVGDLLRLVKQFHEAFCLTISMCRFWGDSMMVKSLCFSQLSKFSRIKRWSVITLQLSLGAMSGKHCFELFLGWLKNC